MTKIVEYRGYGTQFLVLLEGNTPLWLLPKQAIEISDELFKELRDKGYIAGNKLVDVTEEMSQKRKRGYKGLPITRAVVKHRH